MAWNDLVSFLVIALRWWRCGDGDGASACSWNMKCILAGFRVVNCGTCYMLSSSSSRFSGEFVGLCRRGTGIGGCDGQLRALLEFFFCSEQ